MIKPWRAHSSASLLACWAASRIAVLLEISSRDVDSSSYRVTHVSLGGLDCYTRQFGRNRDGLRELSFCAAFVTGSARIPRGSGY